MAADSWPRIKRKEALGRCELKGNHLFTVDNALSKDECQSFIRAAERLGFEHQGSLGPSKGEAFRDNDRISVQSPALADRLWNSGLSSLFGDTQVDGRKAIGLNPNIRFYRYTQGQKFGQHIDESVELDEAGDARTEYTLLIYLNSGAAASGVKRTRRGGLAASSGHELVGGETVFYSGRKRVVAEVVPAAGMALLHLHGEECMLHEARAVLVGVKYVLRSDVVFQ